MNETIKKKYYYYYIFFFQHHGDVFMNEVLFLFFSFNVV